MLWFLSCDKCAYCKSLWTKVSAICPKCKCKCKYIKLDSHINEIKYKKYVVLLLMTIMFYLILNTGISL